MFESRFSYLSEYDMMLMNTLAFLDFVAFLLAFFLDGYPRFRLHAILGMPDARPEEAGETCQLLRTFVMEIRSC
jgi:hypothetical protein